MANAASGMAVSDDCKVKFLELKRKKTYRFVTFKIDEKQNQITVDKIGGPAESYDSFTASLPEAECRYAVYDFDFVTEDNCQKSKIFFISCSDFESVGLSSDSNPNSGRSPDTSRVRNKMLYASSKDRFRRELDGIHCEVQATDPTEMGIDVIRERAR